MMWSPSGPPKPSSAIAALPSASSRSLYSGSIQARATTLAPFIGPISCAYASTTWSMNSELTIPLSISSSSSARARRSTSLRGSGWCPCSSLISHRLEVSLVQVDVHGCIRLGGVGPQLGGVEAHSVGRVEHLLVPVRLELRNRDDGLDPHDHPLPAAHVAGTARMAGEVLVADAHGVADCEARRVTPRHELDVVSRDGRRPGQRERARARLEL